MKNSFVIQTDDEQVIVECTSQEAADKIQALIDVYAINMDKKKKPSEKKPSRKKAPKMTDAA